MDATDLSIILLSFNSQDYIREAVGSLLSQSFGRFELIIIDDGSKDRTPELIASFRDHRIRAVFGQQNRGIPFRRDQGLGMARGEFVSFFDSDDLAHSLKFEKQIAFLRENPGFAFAGSSVLLIDAQGRRAGKWRLDLDEKMLLPGMLFRNCFLNSAVVFRREASSGFSFAGKPPIGEDYLFWWWMLRKGRGVNLPEYLTSYRRHGASAMHQEESVIEKSEAEVFTSILNDIGITPTPGELELHLLLKKPGRISTVHQQDRLRDWLLRIAGGVAGMAGFSPSATVRVILNRWMKGCFLARRKPLLMARGIFGFGFYLKLFRIRKIALQRMAFP